MKEGEQNMTYVIETLPPGEGLWKQGTKYTIPNITNYVLEDGFFIFTGNDGSKNSFNSLHVVAIYKQ